MASARPADKTTGSLYVRDHFLQAAGLAEVLLGAGRSRPDLTTLRLFRSFFCSARTSSAAPTDTAPSAKASRCVAAEPSPRGCSSSGFAGGMVNCSDVRQTRLQLAIALTWPQAAPPPSAAALPPSDGAALLCWPRN